MLQVFYETIPEVQRRGISPKARAEIESKLDVGADNSLIKHDLLLNKGVKVGNKFISNLKAAHENTGGNGKDGNSLPKFAKLLEEKYGN